MEKSDFRFVPRPVLVFLATVSVAMVIFHLPPAKSAFLGPLRILTAKTAAGVISLCSIPHYRSHDSIYSDRFTLRVTENEALWVLYPLALSLGLNWPGRARKRVLVLALGALGVFALGLLRVLNIFFVGVHSVRMGMVFHDQVWPALILVLAGISWIVWWWACFPGTEEPPGEKREAEGKASALQDPRKT
jgi:hypothetical protein